MCRCLDVKRANYYKWLDHSETQDRSYWNELIELVLRYHETYDHRLGYRSIRDRIERDIGKYEEKIMLLSIFYLPMVP